MSLIDRYYAHTQTGLIVPKEEEIVFGIVKELKGRRGFRQVWDDIDSDIEEEILQEWVNITKSKL